MNTIRKKEDLYEGNERIGFVLTTYTVEIRKEFDEASYTVTSSPADENDIYLLNVTQRVIYFNKNSILTPITDTTNEYLDYPVLLNAQLNVHVPLEGGVDATIQDYSPKIINTEVSKSESNSNAQGETTGSTKSSTTGNSSSISVSGGYSSAGGMHIDVSKTIGYDESNTESAEQSTSYNSEKSSGISMAVEDWGSFASINTLQDSQRGITWNFGQQNPWNALIYKKITDPKKSLGKQVELALPNYITQRLIDNGVVLPPSGLSLNGFDFSMEGNFIIKINDQLIEKITVEHVFKLSKGSHKIDHNKIEVYRDESPIFLTPAQQPGAVTHVTEIPAALLALRPVGQVFDAAIVGFNKKSFDLLPNQSHGFKIRSLENDILIKSSSLVFDGNSPFSTSKNMLCMTIGEQDVTFDIYFKIADSTKNYKITFKHWLQEQIDSQCSGAEMQVLVNDDSDSKMTKYVKDVMQEGGENNILTLSLRNLDYTTIDFHNYLKIGLNKISITVKKAEACQDVKYAINAISIVGGV